MFGKQSMLVPSARYNRSHRRWSLVCFVKEINSLVPKVVGVASKFFDATPTLVVIDSLSYQSLYCLFSCVPRGFVYCPCGKVSYTFVSFRWVSPSGHHLSNVKKGEKSVVKSSTKCMKMTY